MTILEEQFISEMLNKEIYIANAMLYWAKYGHKPRDIPVNQLRRFNNSIISYSIISYRGKPIFALVHYSFDDKHGYGIEGKELYNFCNLFQLYNHLQKLIPKWDKYWNYG